MSPVCTASRELHLVALELVKESFGDNLYSKAMDCIKALRGECIKVRLHLVIIIAMINALELSLCFLCSTLSQKCLMIFCEW